MKRKLAEWRIVVKNKFPIIIVFCCFLIFNAQSECVFGKLTDKSRIQIWLPIEHRTFILSRLWFSSILSIHFIKRHCFCYLIVWRPSAFRLSLKRSLSSKKKDSEIFCQMEHFSLTKHLPKSKKTQQFDKDEFLIEVFKESSAKILNETALIMQIKRLPIFVSHFVDIIHHRSNKSLLDHIFSST